MVIRCAVCGLMGSPCKWVPVRKPDGTCDTMYTLCWHCHIILRGGVADAFPAVAAYLRLDDAVNTEDDEKK